MPNDPDQQATGVRDRDREQDGFAIGSWTHSFDPGTLVTVSPFFHSNRAAYVSGPSEPQSTTDDRVSYYEGGQAVFSQVKGPSNLRAGVYAFAQQDERLFALNSDDASATPFRQSISPHGQVDAAFVDEQWKLLPWWTVNGGLRFTYFDGSFSEHAWSPRAGTAITLPKLGWVFRGSYSRFYQAPPLDTVTGQVLEFAQTQGPWVSAAAWRARRTVRRWNRDSVSRMDRLIRKLSHHGAELLRSRRYRKLQPLLPAHHRPSTHPRLGGECPLGADFEEGARASHLFQPAGRRFRRGDGRVDGFLSAGGRLLPRP